MLEIQEGLKQNSTFDVHVTPSTSYNVSPYLNVRTYSNIKDGKRDIVIESENADIYYKFTQQEAEELISAIQYVLMKERE